MLIAPHIVFYKFFLFFLFIADLDIWIFKTNLVMLRKIEEPFFLEFEQCWWFISTQPILSLNYSLQIIIFLESVLNVFCIVKIILVNRVRRVLVLYLHFQRSLIIQVPKMKRLACSETKFLCPKQSLATQANTGWQLRLLVRQYI